MPATPEAPPDEAVPASDAVLDDALVDVDAAIDDGEIFDDDSDDLYSAGEVKPATGFVIVVAEENQSDEMDDANAGNASSTHDANDDANDNDDVGAAAKGEDDGNEGTPASSLLSPDEIVPDAAPSQPTAQVVTGQPQPDSAQEVAVAAVDELPDSDVPVAAPSPSASAAGGSPTVPALPSEDADDAHDADANTADVDVVVIDSAPTAAAAAASPPPLPYIADIAMLDTGELGEAQPSTIVTSSFSSAFHAQATSATPADEDEEVHPTADSDGPGIDIDKMLDAISAEASQPPAAAPIQAPIGAPTGPSYPFPRPPTGPARMTGRYANNSLPPGPVGAPGATGGIAALSSPPTFPAAASRRGQAARAAQGQNPAASRQANNAREKAAVDRAYQAFLAEEKIHIAEGNWERFPEGSRMFVGNLSQEKVSKRDVFEQFYRFGRLAQVSIKSAYGFVQFHSAAEAGAAMNALEGTEIKGRKIHLEISRIQKKDKGRERDNERDRERDHTRGGKVGSPDRTKIRGGREADHYNGRDQNNGRRSRDDYRPGTQDGRETSPRRDRGRNDSYGRVRNSHDDYSRRSRDRSRSPSHYGSHTDNSKSYRSRRSPSPYGRSRHDSGRRGFDSLKTRQGSDVPDVQFLVTQGLDRDFIKWVQVPFTERGLRTDILLLTPHTPPRDSVIQVHVLEGVIAVVDLDSRAQSTGKIPVQVFNRSAGASNVRFDGYQDLAPPVAAEVVARAKSAAVAQQLPQYPQHQQHQQHYSQGYQPPASYGQQYAVAPAVGYPSAPPVVTAALSNGIDLASLVGQLDNATLAQLLGALQPQQAAAAAPPPASYAQTHQGAQYAAPSNAAQHAQLAALLSTLGAAAAPASTAAPGYGTTAAPHAMGIPAAQTAAAAYPSLPQGADEQTVQAIMAQFAKFRQ